eukprot:16439843-Heterocapsa_arctica.AAC.1
MRGRACRGLLDERGFEARSWPLELRAVAKRSASCEEFHGDCEDVRPRRRDCTIRAIDREDTNNTQ